ncbi:FAD-binding oxidoreductase [Mesorhizobium sp. B3-1-3]|uniref:NAD(P)/FAD-dependent oxidoreductase n=1 Tax=unclassified Mesorhizobium TaxID=325217 RepID=UPI00112A6C6C|nr:MULTISPECIES: FAD-binding oxidoreductase [unclassified Mesorhizobium]TPI67148.1 FAD-binding oxidoreductase [Mesorhizobium sp. B3-1-8]TPI70378.1 FAD-binding oxidoreductase [Mesorhizobium sp. B3-1-3]
MPVAVEPISDDFVLPWEADVVVIGGGIVGVSTAYFLAESGQRVVLCEKGIIAGEQSSRNWGWCRSMGRDPREIPLMVESLSIWRTLNQRLNDETGFRQTGTLYICPDEQAYAKREAWLPHARENGIASVMLRGSKVNEVLTGAAENWAGALYTPSDGVAEPSHATPAIARAARRLGATILQRCAVRGLDMQAGRVAGVVTERGRIRASRVVLAGGAWSSLFVSASGVRFPQLKVVATVLRTAWTDQGPGTAAWGPGLALRKRLDGGYTVSNGMVAADIVPDSFRFFADFIPLLKQEWLGMSTRLNSAFLDEWRLTRKWALDETSPFEKVRTLDPEPSEKEVKAARRNLEQSFPAFRSVPTIASWAGMIDATPDLVPAISEIDSVPGLILSSGYSGHGFGIGPGAGKLTAQIASGQAPFVDPAPFGFSRFLDGRKLRPETGF